MYFGNRRPRGFHHTFRFTDEQREVLDRLRQGISPQLIAHKNFCDDNTTSKHRHANGIGIVAVWPWRITVVVLIVMLTVVLALLT